MKLIGKVKNTYKLIIMNFLILIIIPIAVGIYAQMRIKSAYNKNINRQSKGRITGREEIS